MESRPQRLRWPVGLMVLLAFCFLGVAIYAARHWVPFARFALAMSPMAMIGFGLRLPDDARIVTKSRALLSRFATRAVIATVACAAAIGVGAAVAVSIAAPLSQALLGAAAGAIAATLFVGPALRFGDKKLFPSMADYKPTVEQLSEELASISSPQDVVRAVERIVRRWLPCRAIEFEIDEVSRDTTVKSDANELVLPVLFRGVRLGTLRVAREGRGPLFTSEDRDLLKTIANQGALALAHSIAYTELETRRKQQAAAFREEREALVETLSAEIAHEVRYPINFFRSIFQRASKSRALDEEEVEIGCEEVERLERLVSGLRRIAVQHVERRVVQLGELAARAEMLLRDRIGRRRLSIDLGGGGAIRCDADKVTQVLVNLLANALDATDGRGEVGISWVCTAEQGELSVWDTGPGYGGDTSRLFAPWYTTKARGSGLGLAITSRLVRLHGWTIEPCRLAGRTAFVVAIPISDVLPSAGVPHRPGTALDSETVLVTTARKGEVA